MKKSLLALAALSAFATAAQAQSSVTLYGRLDVGTATIDSAATPATTPSYTKTNALGWNNDQTSLYGFRGTEDLGGGMKANFQVEQKIENTANQFSDVTDGLRAAWVELSGGFGSLRAGYQNTGARDVWTSFSQSRATNVVGELASSTALSSATSHADTNVAAHTAFNTAVKYTAPTVSGLTFGVAMLQNNSQTDGAAKVKSGEGYGVDVKYAAGKFAAAASYTETKTVTTELTGLVNFGLETGDDIDLKVKQTAAAASYDLGVAKVSYIYMNTDQANGAHATEGSYERTSHTLGASAPMGKFTHFATYSFGELEAMKSGYNQDLTGYQVGTRYALSKRTNAYAIYGQAERDASDTTKAKVKGYTVGLTHVF